MDAKLINPFVDAFTTVMPMLGFPEPTRTKLYAAKSRVKSLGVSMLVGFTKQIRGNVVYNMSDGQVYCVADDDGDAGRDIRRDGAERDLRAEQYADGAHGDEHHGLGAGCRYLYAVTDGGGRLRGEGLRWTVPRRRNGSERQTYRAGYCR